MRQLGAVSAGIVKTGALFVIVANARHGPEVVHRPHHAFATLENALQTLEREPTLVDPVQVNHIGSLKLRARGDVCAHIGDVDGKKSFAREAEMNEDDESFP